MWNHSWILPQRRHQQSCSQFKVSYKECELIWEETCLVCFCSSVSSSCSLTGSGSKVQPGQRDYFCLYSRLSVFRAVPPPHPHPPYSVNTHIQACVWGKWAEPAVYSGCFLTSKVQKSTANHSNDTSKNQEKKPPNFGLLSQRFDCVHTVNVWKSFSSLWACWGALDLLLWTPQQSQEEKHQEEQNQAPLIFLLFQYL